MPTQSTDTLIKEAETVVKNKIARILQFVGYASKEGLSESEQVMDEYTWQEYKLNKLFREHLKTIATKSAEVDEDEPIKAPKVFRLMKFEDIEQVRRSCQLCQKNHHMQQVAYSTYHDSLTQVCFICKLVATNINV